MPSVVTDSNDPNWVRWEEAAPKMVMALCEAGYPCELIEFDPRFPNRFNTIAYIDVEPPVEVILKAAALCGVEDMVGEALNNR